METILLCLLIFSTINTLLHGYVIHNVDKVRRSFLNSQNRENFDENGRKSLAKAIVTLLSVTSLPFNPTINDISPVQAREYVYEVQTRRSNRPLTYSIESTTPPSMLPRTPSGERSMVQRLANAKILLIGDHGGDVEADTSIEKKIIEEVVKQAKTQGKKVNILFPPSPARDNFVNSLKSDIKGYINFITIGLPEDVTKRVLANGIEILSDEEKQKYVSSPEEFVNMVKLPNFKTYSDEVLVPYYFSLLSAQVIDEKQTSLSNFLSAQFLAHEYIAQQIVQVSVQSSEKESGGKGGGNGVLTLALLPIEQVRFGYGVKLRLQREINLRKSEQERTENTKDPLYKDVFSLSINPTTDDTVSGIASLRLSLRDRSDLPLSSSPPDLLYAIYGLSSTKNSNLFADFILFSRSPQLKLLSHLKGAIDREGQKPPGEDSVLRAF